MRIIPYNRLIALLGLMSLMVAWTNQASGQELFYRHYTVENGLPHDNTYHLIQDDAGVIWVGTDDGVVSFDGTKFKPVAEQHKIASPYIVDLVQTDSLGMLLSTWGAGVYQVRNDQVYKPKFFGDSTTKINKLGLLSNGEIYVNNNLSSFATYDFKNGKRLQWLVQGKASGETFIDTFYHNYDRIISTNEFMCDGKLYVAGNHEDSLTTIKGCYLFERETTSLQPLFPALKDSFVTVVAAEQDTLYAAVDHTIFKGFDKRILDQFKIQSLSNHHILALRKTHGVFYGIAKNKADGTRIVFSYESSTKQFVNLSEQLRITYLASDFLIDQNQNFWISTYGGGIYMIPKPQGEFLGGDFFDGSTVIDVVKHEAQHFALTSNRLYHFEGNRLLKKIALPFVGERLAVVDDSIHITSVINNSFLGSISGFPIKATARINHVSVPHRKIELVNDHRIDSKKITIHREHRIDTVEAGHHLSSVKRLFTHENQLFVIYAYQPGISVYNLENLKEVQLWGQASGFPFQGIKEIVFDGEFTWIGAANGLFQVKDEKVVASYNSSNGLLGSQVNALHLDAHGALWIGTQRGLSLFKDSAFYHFTSATNQQSSYIKRIKAYDGVIYATGNRGLFVYDNQSAVLPSDFTQLVVDQKDADFKVSSVNYFNPETVELRYQLDQEPWEILTTEQLSLAHLDAGKYALRFSYRDGLTNWQNSDWYHFHVYQPWYRNIVIIAILIVAGALLAIGFIYQRLLQIKRRNLLLKNLLDDREKLRLEIETVRENIAQDFHDELGNKLASISVLSNLAKNDFSKESKAFGRLETITTAANELYSGMHDFIWCLNREHNTVWQVQQYLSEFGERLYAQTDILFYANHTLEEDVKLPHYWGKDLIAIFKEAMTNALKHSGAEKVFLEFSFEASTLIIILNDTGKGIQGPASMRKGGLHNMQTRAERLKAQIEFQTDNGFQVQFRGKVEQV